MLSFFKKNKAEKIEKQGNDSVVSSKELINEEGSASEKEVETNLSIHPGMNVSTEQQYVLRFLNNELPPLQPNQISLAGIELHKEDSRIVVSAFVRNSLSKSISMANTPLLLLDKDGKLVAKKEFDLSELSEIPAESSRPWNFVFNQNDLLTNDIPEQDWKLAFELKRDTPHRLDLEDSWKDSLPSEEKAKLESLVANLEKPKPGEVNFMGLQAIINDKSDLAVTILIRNGNEKNIQIHQLPLQVEDAAGDVIATGGFTLDNFEVKANTTKPWTFIFPKELLVKENFDLTSWKVYPVENK